MEIRETGGKEVRKIQITSDRQDCRDDTTILPLYFLPDKTWPYQHFSSSFVSSLPAEHCVLCLRNNY